MSDGLDKKRYFIINKANVFWPVFVALIFLLIYFYAESGYCAFAPKIISMISSLIFTILSTSIISALFIQKPDYNKVVDDILFKGLLCNDDYLNTIDISTKKDYRNAIMKNLSNNSSDVRNKMFQCISDIIDKTNRYCIENLVVEIEVQMKDSKIVKTINKDYDLYSIDGDIEESNYIIAKGNYNKENYENTSIQEIQIDGESLIKDKDFKKIINSTKDSEDENRYNTCEIYELKQKLKIKNYGESENRKHVHLKMQTIVSTNDLSYVFRLTSPCNCFRFSFRIDDSLSEYKIISHLFGERGISKNNVGINDERHTHFETKTWLFPYDGVAIYLEKIKN